MTVNATLLQAYRDSHYQMNLPEGACVLHVGQHSAEMEAFFTAHDHQHAAFISACNPFSHVLPAAINRSRNGALEQVLCARQLRYFGGVGYSTGAMRDWPSEPGFLILGIKRTSATSIAVGFGHNAFLYIQSHQAVELVLC